MLGFLETFFSVDKDEEQNIQSFSETPAKPTKAKDLTETEDEVQEIHKQTEEEDKEYRDEHTPEDDDQTGDDLGDFGEDTTDTSEGGTDENTENNEDNSEEESDDQMKDGSDKDDFTLRAMSEYEIRTTKIISKKALEYATSSGPDIVGGCAGCSKGNEDAADAAIIDAEITPVERTVPKGGNGSDNGGGSDDFGSSDSGSSDDDFDLGDDFSLYYDKYLAAVNKFRTIAAQEDLLDMSLHNLLDNAKAIVGITAKGVAATTRTIVQDILPAAFNVAKKAGEILANAFVYVKNIAAKIVANKTLLLRVWNTKIKLYLKVVSTEKLAKMKVQCFNKEDFLKIGKATIDVYDTLTKNGDKVANAKLSDKIIVKLINALSSIGVVIDVTKDKIDLSKLYEKRKIGSIMDLGYTPDNIEECILWCIDVSKRIPEEDNASPMLAGFAKVHSFFKSRNNAFERNAANNKISAEKRQEDIGIYVSSELKVKFGADASRIVYQIWNELIAEMLEVCEKYEKALIPGKIKDDDDRS